MKKVFLSVVVFLFLGSSLFAQKGKITGRVISAKTAEPLVGATISINYKQKATKADQNGTYSLVGIEKGSFVITCSFVGYSTKTIPKVTLNEDEVITVDIVMESAADMSVVVVKGTMTVVQLIPSGEDAQPTEPLAFNPTAMNLLPLCATDLPLTK